jgi:hypothetical protein
MWTSSTTPHLSHQQTPGKLIRLPAQHAAQQPCDLRVMENGAATQGDGKDPSGFLSEIIGNPVTVKLNSGVVYKGKSLGSFILLGTWL